MDEFKEYEIWLGEMCQEDDDRDWQMSNEQQQYEEEFYGQ